eukprot:jgi/Botrbrau1/18124/Bobra.53_1s0003.1
MMPRRGTALAAAFLIVFCFARISNADRDGISAATSRAYTAGHAVDGGPKQVDYSQFSKMLASMLVLREGGLPEATQAIPHLAATTHHYLNTQVFLNKHPEINRRLKNFTDFHSYKENTDLLTKISDKMYAKGEKIKAAITSKKDQKITEKIQNKINSVTEALKPPGYDEELAKVNKWLEKFHISVTPKAISAPNKFSNFAGAVSSAVTGLSIGASGITWAPAIVSYGAVGLSASATALSITPGVFSFFPALLNLQPQLAQIQPSMFASFPDGINIQPQGVVTSPNLFVTAPTGINILPQGVTVAASGFVEASTGVNVQAQGISWGPVNHIIP